MDFFAISGGGESGGYNRGGSSCTTDECRQRGIITGILDGVILGVLLLIYGAICYCRCCQGRPLRKNSTFINLGNSNQLREESYDLNAFQSGTWSSRYFQYGKWHGPYQFSLSFDPESMKVTGSGSDNIGTFTINRIYSMTTHRIGLTKIYQASIGNPLENIGH